MVAMAVEASVAQLLRTGFVHVDPHEGNMMFTEDDELCYIDFGLMARVDPINMEAFASGVCHMLAGKYYELSKGAAPRLCPADYSCHCPLLHLLCDFRALPGYRLGILLLALEEAVAVPD